MFQRGIVRNTTTKLMVFNSSSKYHGLLKFPLGRDMNTNVVVGGMKSLQQLRMNTNMFVVKRGFRSSSKLLENFTVNVPPMGEAVTQGVLVEWLKNPGDAVAEDEVFCVLETDKVTVDIRSPQHGVMLKQMANIDETVHTDQPVAEFELTAPGENQAKASSNKDSINDKSSSTTAPPSSEENSSTKTISDVDQTMVQSHELNLLPPRKPSIHFRYGKRDPESADDTSSGKNAATASDNDDDYIEIPTIYGRLPPLTEEEMLRVQLGGADP